MPNLLQISNISKTFSRQVIFDSATFSVGEKKKIAIIGRNGAGKSTLFKIITGEETVDSGEVKIMDNARIGYLKQEDDFRDDDTVLTYLLRESGQPEWECTKVAAKFELKDEKLSALISTLSGGYQMRVKLTLMLLKKPNLILLDEPTNYLDLSTMLLLEKFLINFKESFLIISHDRRFISNTCNEVVEIERGKIYHFPNSLEHYFNLKRERLASLEKFNKKQERKKKHLQKFIDRFGATDSKAKQAKSKEKQLAKIETVEIDKPLSNVRIRIPDVPWEGGFAWRMKSVDIGYGEKKIAEDLEIDIEKGYHVAVLGDNGQGKSTFLKTLAEVIPTLGGSYKKLKNLKVAYYAQHVTAGLNNSFTVRQQLSSAADHYCPDEEIFRIAGNFLFRDDDLDKPIAVLSGGEKSRLCLASIFLNKNDVLLLDEPTNHLDFETAEILAHSLAETNATILFISHDRTFINILADKILEVKDGTIKYFIGDFSEYVEHLNRLSELKANEIAESRDPAEELKALEYEAKKQAKRELGKIENRLDKLNKDRNHILKKFLKNPTKINLTLNVKLKEVEDEIKRTEEDWMIWSEK